MLKGFNARFLSLLCRRYTSPEIYSRLSNLNTTSGIHLPSLCSNNGLEHKLGDVFLADHDLDHVHSWACVPVQEMAEEDD